MRQQGQNFNSIGILEIPEVALQEALINALLHRNYLIASHIRLFVFDDRVEIISPGSLPNTVNVESIKMGIHIERNPILASLIKDIEDVPYRGEGREFAGFCVRVRRRELKWRYWMSGIWGSLELFFGGRRSNKFQ